MRADIYLLKTAHTNHDHLLLRYFSSSTFHSFNSISFCRCFSSFTARILCTDFSNPSIGFVRTAGGLLFANELFKIAEPSLFHLELRISLSSQGAEDGL